MIKTALTWAVVWVPVSLIPLAISALVGSPVPWGLLGRFMLIQAAVGAINGAVFAGALAIAGRRRTFETLSLPLMAACGALGGALFPFAVRTVMVSTINVSIPATVLLWTLVTNAVLGAGCATLTLAIARRAPALPGGTDVCVPAVGPGAG